MELVVYTTVFGRTKPLNEPRVDSGARFVCFTDQPLESPRWEIVRVEPLEAPNRESRRYKQLSHAMFPDADATLWIDSNFVLRVDPARIAQEHPHPVVTFHHPQRSRISDEAQAIIAHGKAVPETVLAQLAAYRADGFDTDANPQRRLSAGGFILRRHGEDVRRFNEFWHRQVQAWTLRDQMSIDYSAWKTGIRIAHFPGSHRDTPYADFIRMQVPVHDF